MDTPENFDPDELLKNTHEVSSDFDDIDVLLERIKKRWDSSLLDKDKQINFWDDTWVVNDEESSE